MAHRDDWRSSLQHVGSEQEMQKVREAVNNAYENMRAFVDYFAPENMSGRDADGMSGRPPREVGGLDRSAQELAGLLGVQYERRFHSDGCVIDPENSAENGSDDSDGSDGHDFEAGCEFADEQE